MLLAASAGSAVAAADAPPLRVDALAVPFPIAGAGDAQVAVLIEVPGEGLLAGSAGGDVTGEVRAEAVAAAGAVADQLAQPFVLAADDAALQRGGLKLYAVLRVPPGDYRLRVTASNAGSGAVGVRESALHVPDFAAGEIAFSPPLFADPPGRWRVFRQSASPHEALPFPFVGPDGESFLPAAAPQAAAGSSLVLYAYGLAGNPQRLQARVAPAGAPAGAGTASGVSLLAAAAGELPGQRRLRARLDGPLPSPGTYQLELQVAGAGVERRLASPLSVVAEVPVQQAASEPPPPPEEPAVLGGDWTPAELAARYRAVLDQALQVGLARAAPALAELELQATPQRRPGQLRALREVEEAVLGPTFRAGGDGLLPIVYLHALADGEYLRRAQPWMAVHNRQWVRQLVDRWLGPRPSAAARALGGQLLAALGSPAEALEVQPRNELALLRLGMAAEKGARYEQAVDWLRQLVEAHPTSRHGKLRLALVLRHLERDREAERLLAGLLDDRGTPPWIAAVAYQELARLQHDGGRREAAEALLRQGIERLGLQALYLQLAFYLEQRQRPDDAVALLNRMPLAATAGETSARYRYNGLPEAELQEARQQIEARVAAGMPQARAALATGPAVAGGGR